MSPSTRSQKEQGTLLTPKRIVHWMILADNQRIPVEQLT